MSARIEHTLDVLIAAGLENETSEREKVERMLDSLQEDEWGKLWELCGRHQIGSIVWAGLEKYPQVKIPEKIEESLREVQKNTAYQYYCMLSFSTLVLSILEEAGIQCYLLKGVALNSLYPREDMRKLADVDVYVPNRMEIGKADEILKAHGFEPEEEVTKYHSGYVKIFGVQKCLLELHWRPCDVLPDLETDREIMSIYNALTYNPDFLRIAGMKIPMLPVTENALELLLHMLQHFIHGGFGVRLLCDWLVFWKKKGMEVDEDRFLKYLRRAGLEGFAWAITQITVIHMGLSREYVPWLKSIHGSKYGDSSKLLYQDVLQGGEFGKAEKSRITILQRERSHFRFYVREVHSMMCARFPRLKRVVIFWPFLWGATIGVFFYNNRRLNRGKTLDVIKSVRDRHSLLEQIKVLDRKGGKK